LIEFACNNNHYTLIQKIPFYVNYKYHSKFNMLSMLQSKNSIANNFAIKRIAFILYCNNIWLIWHNIKSLWLCNKFDGNQHLWKQIGRSLRSFETLASKHGEQIPWQNGSRCYTLLNFLLTLENSGGLLLVKLLSWSQQERRSSLMVSRISPAWTQAPCNGPIDRRDWQACLQQGSRLILTLPHDWREGQVLRIQWCSWKTCPSSSGESCG